MSEPVDLDAIRERVDLVHATGRHAGQVSGLNVMPEHVLASARDVPALLARIAELEAERDGGAWVTRQGWMNGDRFQTYTSSAEGFLPPTGPTHQQRIWTGPVEPIGEAPDGPR